MGPKPRIYKPRKGDTVQIIGFEKWGLFTVLEKYWCGPQGPIDGTEWVVGNRSHKGIAARPTELRLVRR